MMNTQRGWLRAAGLAAGSTALLVLGTTTAGAHVSVTTEEAAAGSSTLLEFSLQHGCDGSPTTEVAIKVPDGINTVAPSVNPGWTVSMVSQKLESPVEDHDGSRLTERVDQVVYTAKTPLADGYRDVLVVSVPLPEDSAGKVLAFPVVQTCQQGETAWVDLPADGQDPEELETPAPAITVTAAEADGHEHGSAAGSDAQQDVDGAHDAAAASEVTATSGSVGAGWGVTGLVAGLAGLALGAAALIRGRQPAK